MIGGIAKTQAGRDDQPRLITALDRTWAAIQARHPDVPAVVITLGAGSGGEAGAEARSLRRRTVAAGRRDACPNCSSGERASPRRRGVLGTLLHGARTAWPASARSRTGPAGPLPQHPVSRARRGAGPGRGQDRHDRVERHVGTRFHRGAVPGRAPPPGRRPRGLPARRMRPRSRRQDQQQQRRGGPVRMRPPHPRRRIGARPGPITCGLCGTDFGTGEL